MDPRDENQNKTRSDPALRQWIAAAVLIALMVACVGLLVANAGSGIGVNGQVTHYRLVSSITQSPFCPPEDPRLSSLLLERKRWIVCLIGESKTGGRPRPSMYRLINLELWK